MKILCVNAGSSSLKFQLVEMPEEKLLISGYFEKIGLKDSFWTTKVNGKKYKETKFLKNHTEAAEALIEELLKYKAVESLDEIKGVGHRVLHGGEKYSDSVLINNEAYQKLLSEKNQLKSDLQSAQDKYESLKNSVADMRREVDNVTRINDIAKIQDYIVDNEIVNKYNLASKIIGLYKQDVKKDDFEGVTNSYIDDLIMIARNMVVAEESTTFDSPIYNDDDWKRINDNIEIENPKSTDIYIATIGEQKNSRKPQKLHSTFVCLEKNLIISNPDSSFPVKSIRNYPL